MKPRTPLGGAGAVALLLCGVACTETDDALVSDVAVARLVFVDSDIQVQEIDDLTGPLQFGSWEVSRAILSVGNDEIDLLAESSNCSLSDSATVGPAVSDEVCREGLVVASSDERRDARLSVVLTMRAMRGEPTPPLAPGADFDGDGFLDPGSLAGAPACTGDQDPPPAPDNCVDNCPYLANLAQTDSNDDGAGDDCQREIDDRWFLDSDGDDVLDGADNCVWRPNEDQGDTFDPVGAECEQEAEVQVAGSRTITLDLTVPKLRFPLGFTTFVAVDFNSLDWIASCDWPAQGLGESFVCTLDPAAVAACATTSALAATSGC